MNQRARKTASSPLEKDSYKLLNNSNFGIDCRNNIDNCYLKPLFEDFSEISYVKKLTTVLIDDTFRDFFSPTSLREEILQTFQAKISALNKENLTYEARKKYNE